jgi:1-aminocyclopropane-1-carboxylate deaminase/D-cysteine desulfhydrase-like pyridoxal-dependent ACC family enzyme
LPQGNLLLDHLFGAAIHWTDSDLGAALEAEKVALAETLRGKGKRPYVIGGSRGKLLGAAAYALMLCELVEQLGDSPLDYIYLCASGATHAGLLLGVHALGAQFRVRAMAPIVWGFDVPAALAATANALGDELRLTLDRPIGPADVGHSEEYVGPAYGIVTRESRAAIELVARTEGLLLDPCYTGKAMAGLIDHIRKGRVHPGASVVFVHTGGTPALFAYAEELLGT